MKVADVLEIFFITMILTGFGQHGKMINGNNKLFHFTNKPPDWPQSVCYPSDSPHKVFKTRSIKL